MPRPLKDTTNLTTDQNQRMIDIVLKRRQYDRAQYYKNQANRQEASRIYAANKR